jgi:hypothetical protein
VGDGYAWLSVGVFNCVGVIARFTFIVNKIGEQLHLFDGPTPTKCVYHLSDTPMSHIVGASA